MPSLKISAQMLAILVIELWLGEMQNLVSRLTQTTPLEISKIPFKECLVVYSQRVDQRL
jgi:hypothetical protein